MPKVLIVEDDRAFGALLQRQVAMQGHEGLVARSLAESLGRSAQFAPDVVFLDVNLPDGSGLSALGPMLELPSHPEVIVITGLGTSEGAERAIRGGAWDYIVKGDSPEDVLLALQRAVDYREQKLASAPRALDLGDLVGKSQALRACYDRVAQAAASDAKVLITGESGTGKEMIAWAIHRNSKRRHKSFVVVDCAALPENLVESMLLGHRKGAFTGAVESRVGLVEEADGGTLFLDEVAEMPLSIQKAFLRTLQEKRFRPVGGDHEVQSDFRLIAATNRDLDARAAAGTFRADLLFRLRGLSIHLPPLRERGDDVRELALNAVARLCDRLGVGTKGLSPEFSQALTRYPWPGNVRELLNAIEQAVAAASDHQTLYPVHLPTEIRAWIAKLGIPPSDAFPHQPPPPVVALTTRSLHEHREAETRRYLEELLRTTHSNVAEACRRSGLSRSRLYALLKLHQLARPG